MIAKRLALALLALLIVLTLDSPSSVVSISSASSAAGPLLPQPLCPPPSFQSGGICIITGDFNIDRTLVLASDTTLDCQGHTLRPRFGSLNSPNNTRPQVGIFLNRVRNVRIKRCQLNGFDFGVFAINSKAGLETALSFELTQSYIVARYAGVTLSSVDKAYLHANTIVHTRAGGRGLYLGRNSDHNRIIYNRFVASLNPTIFRAYRVPGFASSANPEMLTPSAAVIITGIEKSEPTVLNAVINSQLFQLTSMTSLSESSGSSEQNRFESNFLAFSSIPIDGIVVDLSSNTRIGGNRINGPRGVGIMERFHNELPKEFPGRCAMEPSRLCLGDDGCQLLGFDLVNKGPCSSREIRKVSHLPVGNYIFSNELRGPLKSGIVVAGSHTKLEYNGIKGPIGDVRFDAGIRLEGKHAIETAELRFNNVLNAATALSLVQSTGGLKATTFGAKIWQNNFKGYTVAVMTSMTPHTAAAPGDPNYDLQTELSVSGTGNHWDTTCAIGLAINKVRKTDGSINCLVRDSHPLPSPSGIPCPTLPHNCTARWRANQSRKESNGL